MKFNSYNLKILVISSMLVLAACSPGSSGVTQEPITQEPVDIVEATAAAPAQESADSGGVPDGGAIDACSLITQAEAEATLGQPTGPGQPDDAPPIYSCSYQTTDFDVEVSGLIRTGVNGRRIVRLAGASGLAQGGLRFRLRDQGAGIYGAAIWDTAGICTFLCRSSHCCFHNF